MKFNYLLIVLVFISCVKASPVQSFVNTYGIESIRVDDDAEYHIVGIDTSSGRVVSYHDLSIDEYGVRIYYKAISKAVMEVTYDDSCCGKNNYSKVGAIRVYLPYGYKIDTFND